MSIAPCSQNITVVFLEVMDVNWRTTKLIRKKIEVFFISDLCEVYISIFQVGVVSFSELID